MILLTDVTMYTNTLHLTHCPLHPATICVSQAGDVVGYSVKMDNKSSHRTRLLFCTTGILMRRLSSEPLLESISHVVLDEVRYMCVYEVRFILLCRAVQFCAAWAVAFKLCPLKGLPATPVACKAPNAPYACQLEGANAL
jgi:hypothetical protein